jgi:hypothetical protein
MTKADRLLTLEFRGIPAIAIMFSTIAIKGVVWVWYRSVKNSSVQAL